MKIAAVDYGLNIGLAIAEFSNGELKCVHLGTHYDADEEVAAKIIDEKCNFVVLEDPPHSTLGGSANSFYTILEALKSEGYEESFLSKTFLAKKGIARYSPGIWKPIVQTLQPDLSAWNPKTQHEKDAMGIMWYALRTILKQEVKYV